MAGKRRNDPTDRRTACVSFFVTPAERDELNERAEALDIGRSEFLRIVALSELKKPAPSARDGAAIRALAVEVSRVGNNINQLAKIANEVRDLPSRRAFDEVSAGLIATLEKVMAL